VVGLGKYWPWVKVQVRVPGQVWVLEPVLALVPGLAFLAQAYHYHRLED
jgi:hypothetical protein